MVHRLLHNPHLVLLKLPLESIHPARVQCHHLSISFERSNKTAFYKLGVRVIFAWYRGSLPPAVVRGGSHVDKTLAPPPHTHTINLGFASQTIWWHFVRKPRGSLWIDWRKLTTKRPGVAGLWISVVRQKVEPLPQDWTAGLRTDVALCLFLDVL